MRGVIGLWFLGLVLAPATVPAAEQAEWFFGSVGFSIDPSARAAGMGQASAAVFWGDGPNVWANPALLGTYHGLRYERSKTQLVPSLAEDVFFTADRFQFGGYGVGVSVEGKPFGLGGLELDYGRVTLTGTGGEMLAPFHPTEAIDGFGVGVSLNQAMETVLHHAGADPYPISKYVEAAFGWRVKTYRDMQAQDPMGHFEVTARDRGVLARVTPINGVDPPRGVTQALDEVFSGVGGIRVDLAFAASQQDYDDQSFQFNPSDPPVPVRQKERAGWAVHAALGMPPGLAGSLREGGLGWLVDVITPLVRVGGAWDHVEVQPPLGEQDPRHIRYRGGEVTLFDLVSYRWGHVRNPENLVDRHVNGWGVTLRFGDVAGVSYDRGERPQVGDMENVEPQTFAVFFDPFALKRFLDRE